MRKRKALRDSVGVRGIDLRRLTEPAAALRILARQQVAFACVHAHHFACASDFKTFRDRLFCFDAFWATHMGLFVF
jgi:hypothetical protein